MDALRTAYFALAPGEQRDRFVVTSLQQLNRKLADGDVASPAQLCDLLAIARPDDYRDVATERAVRGLCAFPLCRNSMVATESTVPEGTRGSESKVEVSMTTGQDAGTVKPRNAGVSTRYGLRRLLLPVTPFFTPRGIGCAVTFERSKC